MAKFKNDKAATDVLGKHSYTFIKALGTGTDSTVYQCTRPSKENHSEATTVSDFGVRKSPARNIAA